MFPPPPVVPPASDGSSTDGYYYLRLRAVNGQVTDLKHGRSFLTTVNNIGIGDELIPAGRSIVFNNTGSSIITNSFGYKTVSMANGAPWTFCMHCKLTAANRPVFRIWSDSTDSNGSGVYYEISMTGKIEKWQYYAGIVNTVEGNAINNSVAVSNIRHFAVTQSGGTHRVFVNGQLISTGSVGNTYAFKQPKAKLYNLQGQVDDVCFIWNKCLWTSNFTVPTTYLPNNLNNPIV